MSFALKSPLPAGQCASGETPVVDSFFLPTVLALSDRYTTLVITVEACAHGLEHLPNSYGAVSIGNSETVIGHWSPAVLSHIYKGSATQRPGSVDKITVSTSLTPDLRSLLIGHDSIRVRCRYQSGPHMMVIFGVSMSVE